MIEFTILGVPVPKGRPRFKVIKLGRGANAPTRVQTYTPPETVAAERAFQLQALKWRPRKPLDGPLKLELVFVVPWPARLEPGRSRLWPHVKPDVDNYAKLVMDSLNGMFWHDDGQVCCAPPWKIYGSPPRTWVRITPLTAEDHAAVLALLGESTPQASLI